MDDQFATYMPKAETSRRIDIELYPNIVDANRSSTNVIELNAYSRNSNTSACRVDARNLPTTLNKSSMSDNIIEKKITETRGDAASSSQEEKRK